MKTDYRSLLHALRRDFSGISSCAQPFWHPLGFVSCVISEKPGISTVRLHYWPSDERKPKTPNWPIHTHIYELNSLVLVGQVRDIQYRVRSGSDYHVYEVNYQGQGSKIEPTGQTVSVEPVVDAIRNAGQDYNVPTSAYHQTCVPNGEEALTLVAFSNYVSDKPRVLGLATGQSFSYLRTPYDERIFWSRVDEFLKASRT